MAGDAFAIVMLGFVAVVRITISNIYPFFEGAHGISDIPRLTTIWTVLPITVIMIWLMRNFLKSHYGKNCIAINQQELAAEMVGVDTVKAKLIALMISAFYGGISGGLFSFFATYIAPTTFAEAKSDDLLAAVVLGGMCSLSGPILATVFLGPALPGALAPCLLRRGLRYHHAVQARRPYGISGDLL